MTDSVSVVIPTYNYGHFIGEAIESVLGQTVVPAEVVVVDDGSTDGTAEAVREFGERVRYVRQENAGVCAARNRGVAETTGEFIAFLDADDIWEPRKLEKQLGKFAEDAAVGLVHCGMREFDSETGETLGVTTDGAEGGEVWRTLLLWEAPAINGPGAVMVRRTAFEEAGRFDTAMKVGEDWDLCYRVARRWKVGFVPEALLNYRSHAAGAHRNVREMERGMGRFYEKAFAEGDPAVTALRRRAMGNYHKVLAGSYYQAGDLGAFARHSLLSVWNRPGNVGYFWGKLGSGGVRE